AGVCHSSGQARTPIDQRLRLARRAIVDGDLVASLEQGSGHCGSHLPQADESDFHDWLLSLDSDSKARASQRRMVRLRAPWAPWMITPSMSPVADVGGGFVAADRFVIRSRRTVNSGKTCCEDKQRAT